MDIRLPIIGVLFLSFSSVEGMISYGILGDCVNPMMLDFVRRGVFSQRQVHPN